MDAARFPWPPPVDDRPADRRKQLLFAGLVQEPIKGYHVLREACAILWKRRQDFEVIVTSDPPEEVDDFARFVGGRSRQSATSF